MHNNKRQFNINFTNKALAMSQLTNVSTELNIKNMDFILKKVEYPTLHMYL